MTRTASHLISSRATFLPFLLLPVVLACLVCHVSLTVSISGSPVISNCLLLNGCCAHLFSFLRASYIRLFGPTLHRRFLAFSVRISGIPPPRKKIERNTEAYVLWLCSEETLHSLSRRRMSVGPREVAGGATSSGALLNSSIPAQGSQTIIYLAFEVTTSVIVVTSTSMSHSQVVSTTATTFTISLSTTVTTTPIWTPSVSPSPTSQDETHLLHNSIIIASVLGGFTILLISTLAITYFISKRRKRQRELDYSPPFTSLAPPPRSALSPLTIRSSQIQPEEPQETSLSMGPGIHTTEPKRNHLQDPAQQQQQQQQQAQRSEKDSPYPFQNPPAIVLQPSPASPPPNRSRAAAAQSRLYHDLLREETEADAARRHGRPEPPGPSALRPLSGFSDISYTYTGTQLQRPSGEGEDEGEGEAGAERRAGWRGFPSTRASSEVFPHD